MKNNYTSAYFKTLFMTKKTLILGNLLLILWLIFAYTFSSKNTVEKLPNEITIFTREPLLGIHAKMITGDDTNIYISVGKNLSREELAKLNESTIILSSKTLSESDMAQELQSYKWLYITIPTEESKTHSINMLTGQIWLIRDTLSDVTPSHRWFYYDNAGNYIHLLNTTLTWFRTRIDKYKPLPFITVGDNLTNFLETLGIEKYRTKHYSTPDEFLSDKKIGELLEEGNINYVFVSGTTNDTELKKLQQKYPLLITYHVPDLQADTSRWGYIRFSEKMMNDFVAAFDTYD
jgi:ABC-type Zn uptake system ZnuABC Zn-binding protein ZnuA